MKINREASQPKPRASSWAALVGVVGGVFWLHVWGLSWVSLPQPLAQAGVPAEPAVFVLRDATASVNPSPAPARLSAATHAPQRTSAPLVTPVSTPSTPTPAQTPTGAVEPEAGAVAQASSQPSQEFPAAQAAAPPAVQGAQAGPQANQMQAAPSELPAAEPAAGPTAEVLVPASARLRYRVQSSKLPFGVVGDLWWHRQGDTYEAQLALQAWGMERVQSSRGRVTKQGLEPVRFSDKYRSELAAHFDWQAGVATFSANTPNAALQAGAQDRLSVMLQLASWAAAAPMRFTPKHAITVQVVGPRAAESWVFVVQDWEELDLPAGRLKGLKLMRQPREPYDQKVELWLAPTLAYLPARIRITQSDGDFVDQLWVATEPAGDAP